MPAGATSPASLSTPSRVRDVLRSLERQGNARTRDGMARYGIVAPKAFGVTVAELQQLAKRSGKDHALAGALWTSGWYEARMLACFVDEPARVTAAQMDRWCKDFDNWAVCDHACFHLFDRTTHAWRKVKQWSDGRGEFVKRAAFALLASLALHDKSAPDDAFMACLPLIEDAADDDRNFVKKAVSWALRGIGRRSTPLNDASTALALRLAASPVASARWIGKDAAPKLAVYGKALRKSKSERRLVR